MSHAIDSKSAAAALLDPLNAPEPSAEDGPGTHFGSTFAPANEINGISPSYNPFNTITPSSSTTRHPTREASLKHQTSVKKEPTVHERSVDHAPSIKHSEPYVIGGPPSTTVRTSPNTRGTEKFPPYRADAVGDNAPAPPRRNRAASQATPPSYQQATSPQRGGATDERPHRRRGSSLKERYPGDPSTAPLDVIRRDSRKAYRSPHLNKKTLPGADSIDRLDPAIGGRAYHHEGPYDAALLARNRDPKTAPLNAIKDSNAETIRATPRENIKDAVERHRPLDGVAAIAPGDTDRYGRKYDYESSNIQREGYNSEPGYKQWPGVDYSPEDTEGQSEPSFSLDRALRAHKISDGNDNNYELQDRSRVNRDYHDAERRGTLDSRDPVNIAGGDSKYVDMEIAAQREAQQGSSTGESHSKLGSIKKRIGSLRRKNDD